MAWCKHYSFHGYILPLTRFFFFFFFFGSAGQSILGWNYHALLPLGYTTEVSHERI